MRRLLLVLPLLASCAETAAPVPRPQKSSVITHGGAYAPGDYLVPGYVTILFFTADW